MTSPKTDTGKVSLVLRIAKNTILALLEDHEWNPKTREILIEIGQAILDAVGSKNFTVKR